MWNRLSGNVCDGKKDAYSGAAAKLIQAMAANQLHHGLRYHTITHLQQMFDHLECYSIPYDRELELAILGHDVVYDNVDRKEQRSLDLVLKIMDQQGVQVSSFDEPCPQATRIGTMIMCTQKHTLIPGNRPFTHLFNTPACSCMIGADLHRMANLRTAEEDWDLVRQESIQLYACTEAMFAEANGKFMRGLYHTIAKDFDQHVKFGVYPKEFWGKVLRGIDYVSYLSSTHLKG